MNTEQVQEALSLVSDPATRQKYREDPKAAYADLMELAGVPGDTDDLDVKVVVNTADTHFVVLPGFSDSLSSDELREVSAAGSSQAIAMAIATGILAGLSGLARVRDPMYKPVRHRDG